MSYNTPQPGALEQQLMSWAGEYAGDPTNKLVALAYAPDKYTGQTGHVVRADHSDRSLVRLIATEAFKPNNFDSLLNQLETPEQTERLHATGELLEGQNNIVLATNHGDLIDIAIAHAAVYHQLETLGYRPRTGIIISKMVAFLAYELLGEPSPCTEVLKALEHETFLSFPRTASAEKHGIARLLPDEVERHNRHMRHDVIKSLGSGSLLLAVAMSGTTDKPVNEVDPLNQDQLQPNETVISMAPVGNGTAKMLVQKHTYVLPAALYYKTGAPHMTLTDTPRYIKNADVLHDAMGSIADNLNENIPDIHYQYSRPAQDPA